jgi:signal transduction histidine kinase
VLLHLESNAIKFRGSQHPYVVVSASAEEQRIVISVKDNGTGIPVEKLSRIFLPFVQGDDSYTSPTTGAGLGLSICKSLVERHGGNLWVESEVGKGSRFFFSLPHPPSEIKS